jgi:predicted P-loop ATPase
MVKWYNTFFQQAAQDEYDKVEALWIKKFQETANYSKKVHTELKAFVDHRHEEARKKAFGKHQYLYSGQEKANDMLLEGEKC